MERVNGAANAIVVTAAYGFPTAQEPGIRGWMRSLRVHGVRMSSIRTPAAGTPRAAHLRLAETTARSRVRPGRARIHVRRRRRRNAEGASFTFALRLVLSFAAALIVVGIAGYWFMDVQLRGRRSAATRQSRRSDAQTFEYYGKYAQTQAQAAGQIGRVVDAISRQPGVPQALLIGPSGVIRASGKDFLDGPSGTDAHVVATLRSGTSYAGHENDPRVSQSIFEFFVIAEGIEDSETLEFLESVDYDRFRGHGTIQGGQGYGLGLPTPDIRCAADMPLRGSSAAA